MRRVSVPTTGAKHFGDRSLPEALDELLTPASSSSAESGPTRPRLAFDGASDASATSAANDSPRTRPHQQALWPSLSGFIGGDVLALAVRRDGDQEIARSQRRGRGELVLMLGVVGLRLDRLVVLESKALKLERSAVLGHGADDVADSDANDGPIHRRASPIRQGGLLCHGSRTRPGPSTFIAVAVGQPQMARSSPRPRRCHPRRHEQGGRTAPAPRRSCQSRTPSPRGPEAGSR